MRSTASLFQDRPTSTPPKAVIRSARDEQIQNFADKQCIKLRDRRTKELRLATAGEIALILKDCPTGDLYPFFRQCEGARSFSRFFWWAVKRRKPSREIAI